MAENIFYTRFCVDRKKDTFLLSAVVLASDSDKVFVSSLAFAGGGSKRSLEFVLSVLQVRVDMCLDSMVYLKFWLVGDISTH